MWYFTERQTGCDAPDKIEHGNWHYDVSVLQPGYYYRSRIIYACDAGYQTLTGDVETVLTCLESGFWSADAPECLPIG